MASNTTPTDPAPLAKLRPGMPLKALIDAYGPNWARMAPSDTFFFAEPMGFLARIDVNGLIGAITFAKKFPLPVEFGGVRRGMPLEQALAARPDLLDAGIAPGTTAVRLFRLTLPDALQLELRVLDDIVIAMELSKPDAVYERKISYPSPVGKPGAPFTDPNLKLVVLSSLIDAGTIHLGPRKKLAAHLLGPGYDEDQDGYCMLKPVYDYLVRYPLTANHLAAVTSIEFDGGSEIYNYPFPFWDGEDGEFDVASLEGIERLINLKRIEMVSLLNDPDLSRLAALRQLEHLGLNGARYQNGDALLELPALKSLTCSTWSFSDPALIPALRARSVGVTVRGLG
jgi:uncharacterized protein DUF6892